MRAPAAPTRLTTLICMSLRDELGAPEPEAPGAPLPDDEIDDVIEMGTVVEIDEPLIDPDRTADDTLTLTDPLPDALPELALLVAAAEPEPETEADTAAHWLLWRASAACCSAVLQVDVKHWVAEVRNCWLVQTQLKSVKLEQPAAEAALVTQVRMQGVTPEGRAVGALEVWACAPTAAARTVNAASLAEENMVVRCLRIPRELLRKLTA
jgi:hypothetical protein